MVIEYFDLSPGYMGRKTDQIIPGHNENCRGESPGYDGKLTLWVYITLNLYLI
jgi:hypothetical protein